MNVVRQISRTMAVQQRQKGVRNDSIQEQEASQIVALVGLVICHVGIRACVPLSRLTNKWHESWSFPDGFPDLPL